VNLGFWFASFMIEIKPRSDFTTLSHLCPLKKFTASHYLPPYRWENCLNRIAHDIYHIDLGKWNRSYLAA